MRSLFDPRDQAGKGGKPEDGVDDIDSSVYIGIGKAAYPLENGGGGLINESRYAAPTLQRVQLRVLMGIFL